MNTPRSKLRLAVALSMLAALARGAKVNFTRNHIPRRYRRVGELKGSPKLRKLLTVRRPATSRAFAQPWDDRNPIGTSASRIYQGAS